MNPETARLQDANRHRYTYCQPCGFATRGRGKEAPQNRCLRGGPLQAGLLPD
jgi:hypothetical protein